MTNLEFVSLRMLKKTNWLFSFCSSYCRLAREFTIERILQMKVNFGFDKKV